MMILMYGRYFLILGLRRHRVGDPRRHGALMQSVDLILQRLVAMGHTFVLT